MKKREAKARASRRPCAHCGSKVARRVDVKAVSIYLCKKCRSVPPSECEVCRLHGGSEYEHIHRRSPALFVQGRLAESHSSRSDMEFVAKMFDRCGVPYRSALTTEDGTIVGGEISLPTRRVQFMFDTSGKFLSVGRL